MTAAAAIDIHHHYVPSQVIEEARRHADALGVGVIEVRGQLRFVVRRQQAASIAAADFRCRRAP